MKASSDLLEHPFYRSRQTTAGPAVPWTLDDLEEYAAAHGDPFAGRLRPGAKPLVSLQLEATSEPPVWTALDRGELDAWAAGVARLWARWGLSRGEAIAFYDYGSSPLVLLASASYVAHLGRGAADRLGVTAVCNDGVASQAERMIAILNHVRPAAIVLRRDLLSPLADAARARGGSPDRLRWIAVSEPEGAPPAAEAARYENLWKTRVHRVLRADAAFFIAGDCETCGFFHLDPRLYEAEALEGEGVAVSARFARLCPALRYAIRGAELRPPGCPREPRVERIVHE